MFLSDPDLDCRLQGAALNRICLTDRDADDPRGARPGILAALQSRRVDGIPSTCKDVINSQVARRLSRVLESALVRPSQKARRVGDYTLGALLGEGQGYQDRVASHVQVKEATYRARQYLVAQATSEEDRQRLQRAAEREYRLLCGLDHPHILAVHDFKIHEYGPVLTFQHDANAVRLEHYLAARGGRLSSEQRLALLRQLADAIRYAHRHRVIHRALSPQSVLVFDADTDSPALKVFNRQVGVRDSETASSGTTHVEQLVDRQGLVFLAPEALLSPRQVTQAADVFSLGAIAFYLFAGRPPAANLTELTALLKDHKGLSLAAVLDGAGPQLCNLVTWSTHPDVAMRTDSAEDFPALLDEVEKELKDPDAPPPVDPLYARSGDDLPGGFRVQRVLGQGSTGLALLVERDGEALVLKVARTPEDNQRLS